MWWVVIVIAIVLAFIYVTLNYLSSCSHINWSELNEKNIQYCKSCGKARHVNIPCSHVWEIMRSSNIFHYDYGRDIIVGTMHIQKCQKCGEIKATQTNVR